MPIVVAVLLAVAAFLFVLYPLLGVTPGARGADGQALAEIGEQESSAKQALRDVDFDRRLGNLDDEDYRELRDRFEESAIEAMQARYRRERELDLAIDRQLASLSAAGPASAKRSASASSERRGAVVRPDTDASATPAPELATEPSGETRTRAVDGRADRRAALRKRRGA